MRGSALRRTVAWTAAWTVGLLAAAAAVVPASAQQLTVELRAGAAVGNYTVTDAGLDFVPAPSFAAGVELDITELVAGYVSVNWSMFGCEESLCSGRDMSLASRGAAVGGRLSRGILWARAGLALQALRVSSEVETETSELGLGWDLAAGLQVPIGRRFLVRPGLTYLRHQAATDVDGHAAVLALEVGVGLRL